MRQGTRHLVAAQDPRGSRTLEFRREVPGCKQTVMPRGLAIALLLGSAVVPCANAAPDAVPVRADIQVRIDPRPAN